MSALVRLTMLALIVGCGTYAFGADRQQVPPQSAPVMMHGYDGIDQFNTYCASCHGTTAKGDGTVGALLKKRPPDLTTLHSATAARSIPNWSIRSSTAANPCRDTAAAICRCGAMRFRGRAKDRRRARSKIASMQPCGICSGYRSSKRRISRFVDLEIWREFADLEICRFADLQIWRFEDLQIWKIAKSPDFHQSPNRQISKFAIAGACTPNPTTRRTSPRPRRAPS